MDEETKLEVERLRKIEFLKPRSEVVNEEEVLNLIREYEILILAPEARPVEFHPIRNAEDLNALSVYDHWTGYRHRYDELWQSIWDERKVAFMSQGRAGQYLNKLIEATKRNAMDFLKKKGIPKGVQMVKLFVLMTANTSAYISLMLYPAGPNPMLPIVQLMEQGYLCISTKEKWIVVYQVAEPTPQLAQHP